MEVEDFGKKKQPNKQTTTTIKNNPNKKQTNTTNKQNKTKPKINKQKQAK